MLRPCVLRRQADFSAVYSKGRSAGDRYVVVFYLRNGLSYSRTAFLASKKVGNSVRRNRARRLMREAYRSMAGDMKQGYDLIFIARNSINDKKYEEVRRSLVSAVRKAGLGK